MDILSITINSHSNICRPNLLATCYVEIVVVTEIDLWLMYNAYHHPFLLILNKSVLRNYRVSKIDQ